MDFITLRASGDPLPPVIVLEETIYCITQANRVRWTLSGAGAVEASTNTISGTHDGLTTTLDKANSTLDAGLGYSVGYSVATPSIGSIARVTLRLRCLSSGSSAAFHLLDGAYDNTPVGSVRNPGISWTWHEFPMDVNPSTGVAWANAAAVSAKKWGFAFDSDVASGVDSFSCAEIELLIERA